MCTIHVSSKILSSFWDLFFLYWMTFFVLTFTVTRDSLLESMKFRSRFRSLFCWGCITNIAKGLFLLSFLQSSLWCWTWLEQPRTTQAEDYFFFPSRHLLDPFRLEKTLMLFRNQVAASPAPDRTLFHWQVAVTDKLQNAFGVFFAGFFDWCRAAMRFLPPPPDVASIPTEKRTVGMGSGSRLPTAGLAGIGMAGI